MKNSKMGKSPDNPVRGHDPDTSICGMWVPEFRNTAKVDKMSSALNRKPFVIKLCQFQVQLAIGETLIKTHARILGHNGPLVKSYGGSCYGGS